jgi:hypothetical protein
MTRTTLAMDSRTGLLLVVDRCPDRLWTVRPDCLTPSRNGRRSKGRPDENAALDLQLVEAMTRTTPAIVALLLATPVNAADRLFCDFKGVQSPAGAWNPGMAFVFQPNSGGADLVKMVRAGKEFEYPDNDRPTWQVGRRPPYVTISRFGYELEFADVAPEGPKTSASLRLKGELVGLGFCRMFHCATCN